MESTEVSESPWGFPEMVAPNSWMAYGGKSHLEMDDDQGYPYLSKPPHRIHCVKHILRMLFGKSAVAMPCEVYMGQNRNWALQQLDGRC